MFLHLKPERYDGVKEEMESRRPIYRRERFQVVVGIVLATIFVTDQLMGVAAGAKTFPFLHHVLTLNYTYRGLWGTICVVTTLFGVSYLTPPPKPEQLATTTVNWGEKWERFQGITDWRLHLAGLGIVTVLCYWWLW